MNVILCGYGRMGLMIEQMIVASDDMNILGVVHPGLYESPLDVPGTADVIVDFSYPGNLEGILARARQVYRTVSNEENYYEIMVLGSEAVEARQLLIENNLLL